MKMVICCVYSYMYDNTKNMYNIMNVYLGTQLQYLYNMNSISKKKLMNYRSS